MGNEKWIHILVRNFWARDDLEHVHVDWYKIRSLLEKSVNNIYDSHGGEKSMLVFWLVIPYERLCRYRRFGEPYCFSTKDEDSMFPKSLVSLRCPHGDKIHKFNIDIW
jgi:hypothetical protein